MAYLVSRYPAISHTFILREIQRLRALGHTIFTASINPPDRATDAMEGYERQEAKDTFFVKAQGWLGALSAMVYWLGKAPLKLMRTLRLGLRLGKGGHWLYGLAYTVEAALVARWMQQRGLARLHVHFGNAGATVGVLVKQLTDCHLSYTIHGPDEFDDVPGQHLPLKMQHANDVVCISQFAKGQLMRISQPEHWPKLRVCRLGVDPAQFSYTVRESGAAAVKLLCVGRLSSAKAQILLVQACADLRDEGLDFALTLVGDGPDRARIEHAIASLNLGDRIHLTGALNQAAVRAHFERADIFVLPSLAEGIPVVLMEAMSSGVPCISTPVNGIPELIQHDHTGLLATPGDVDSLTEQLRRLIQQPALRQALAHAAHIKVLADFDLNRNVAQLSRIFAGFEQPVAGYCAKPVGRIAAAHQL
jgi:glycosyltransferase involved in cell wall biosynthesis